MGLEDAIEGAASILSSARGILAFTGAGISTESGIPDFRGPDGLWTRLDPDDFSIGRYMTSRDVRVRRWRMHQQGELWGARSRVAPNPAHHAIVELSSMRRLAGCITQNVDGLHQAAGLDDASVAEVHGNVRKAACVGCGARWPTETVLGWVDAGMEDPRCPECDGIVKPTTVLFGELLPDAQVDRAVEFAATADAVLAVGTTMSVYPAADFAMSVVGRGCPLVIVNVGRTEGDARADAKVEAHAGIALPALVERLRS